MVDILQKEMFEKFNVKLIRFIAYNHLNEHIHIPFFMDSELLTFQGHRFKFRIYPGGIGQGYLSHMSVFLVLIGDKQDPNRNLPSAMRFRISLAANGRSLKNVVFPRLTIRSGQHLMMDEPGRDPQFGFEKFISHNMLARDFVIDGDMWFVVQLVGHDFTAL